IPDLWVSRSRNVIGRSAGYVWSRGPLGERRTRICENSGAQRVIGSLNANRPSSNSISATVEVIGFVIEAMRKRVFLAIGRLDSTSLQPTAAVCITLPSRQTSVAAPARPPALTILLMADAINSSPIPYPIVTGFLLFRILWPNANITGPRVEH